MTNINITIRANKIQKAHADKLFEELVIGLTMSFDAFVRQTLREGRIPFKLTAQLIHAQSRRLTIYLTP